MSVWSFKNCRFAQSIEYNIELNTKNDVGMSAFHLACQYGHSKIAEMLIPKSKEVNIELNTKYLGMTDFQMACENGHSKIAAMRIQKYTECKGVSTIVSFCRIQRAIIVLLLQISVWRVSSQSSAGEPATSWQILTTEPAYSLNNTSSELFIRNKTNIQKRKSSRTIPSVRSLKSF